MCGDFSREFRDSPRLNRNLVGSVARSWQVDSIGGSEIFLAGVLSRRAILGLAHGKQKTARFPLELGAKQGRDFSRRRFFSGGAQLGPGCLLWLSALVSTYGFPQQHLSCVGRLLCFLPLAHRAPASQSQPMKLIILLYAKMQHNRRELRSRGLKTA